MQPELHLGPLTLQTFGIMFSLGFIASGLVIARRLAELGKPIDWAYEIVLAGLVGGLVGARAYFVIQHWDTASDDLLGSIFSGDGLVWYGGAIGGTLAVVAWAYWRCFLSVTLLDVCAPALALGYAVGRVGCQVSGDGDYGIGSHLPWAMSYPDGTVATTQRVHPTPIYESIAMGLIAWGLWLLRDRVRPGILFAIYLIAAGSERFLVEFIRRNDSVAAGLTAPQLESLVLILAGATWLMLARVRQHRLATV